MMEEIKEALEKATPGKWSWDVFINGYGVKAGTYTNQVALVTEKSGINRDREQAKNNAVLIANAPEWLRYLLGEVERLKEVDQRECLIAISIRNENKELRKALEEISTYPPFEETNNGDRFYEQMQQLARQAIQSPKEK